MPTLLRKQLYFKAETAQPGDEENFIIRGTFSTADEDRQGDVVVQTGWDLSEFMLNPVVLFAHDHYQPAVAKVIEIGINSNGNLAGAIQFAAKEYDFALTLYKLYAGGYMRAFSAGFMNMVYENDQENDRFILKENKLYELSCVNVPANALALAAQKGIDVSPLEKLQTLCKKQVDQHYEETNNRLKDLETATKDFAKSLTALKTSGRQTSNEGKTILVKSLNKTIRRLLKDKKNLKND